MADAPPILPRTAPPEEVLRAALVALDAGRRVVLATVIARHGSTPSTPGQKLALFGDRAAVGTIGGGAIERVVIDEMLSALDDPGAGPRVSKFKLAAALGMCCGGSVEILIEPLQPARYALVIGAGHVGVVTAPLLASLGFRVVLVDAREGAAEPSRLGSGAEGVALIAADHDDPEVAGALPRDLSAAAVVVMTHDHQLDQAAIEWAIGRGFGFVGGVGSRAKAARTRQRLEAKGVPEGDIARVRMPVGVDIGARSPAEIGVSIAAELVAWRAGALRASTPRETSEGA
jgi:xanthine dehydrogenase accessory factor